MLTIIIPTFNADATLGKTLASLGAAPNLVDEIVVADGGSNDQTIGIADAAGARIVKAPRGRGSQLAAGTSAAKSDWLLVLHADTTLSGNWQADIATFVGNPANSRRAAAFGFALDDIAPAARRLERLVAWRCRILGLPYGDQGLLIARDFLAAIGGYRALPLMEDVDLVRRIGKSRLSMLESRAVTSAARYRSGYLRRSLRNLSCLVLYFAGLPTPLIARLYG